MFRLILVSSLIAVVLGSLKVRPRVPMLDGRIVGGKDTSIKERPYQLSFQLYGSHICGASIVSATKALTGAHCTDGIAPEALSVRSGSSIREQGGDVTIVKSICQHPNFDPWSFDNDVSVLILAADIPLGPGAAIVKLAPAGYDVFAGTLATVSGWGATSQGGDLAYNLHEVDIPRVGDASCKSTYGSRAITDRMICFGFTSGGKDFCQGDFGGPLVVKNDNIQIGVASWGYGCVQPNYPGVYAKVSSLRGHIDSC